MRCVGYRQVWEMLEGRLPAAELRDRGIFATRQFAKRQITWLNAWTKERRELAVVDCLQAAFRTTITAAVGAHLA